MTPPASRPRSRRWMGFFLVLAVLATAAVVVPIVYNLSIQLRPEQLADAQRRWRENAPADYNLEYLVKTTHAGQEEESQYLVIVRSEQAVLVMCNGEVVYLDPSLAVVAGAVLLAVSSGDGGRYGIPALLDEMEAAQRRDATGGRRNFATASFDPNDGHPYHYVHRVRDTKERVEWNLKLTRVARSDRPPERGASAP